MRLVRVHVFAAWFKSYVSNILAKSSTVEYIFCCSPPLVSIFHLQKTIFQTLQLSFDSSLRLCERVITESKKENEKKLQSQCFI